LKLLLDFFPIVLFFAAFKIWDIYVATAVAMVATIAQIAWMRYSTGKVHAMQWMSLGIILVFGGATMLLHDATFIKWKPTILYWAMGGVLAFGQVVLGKNWLKVAMGAELDLPEPAWRALTWSWIAFFAVMGAVNLWVAYNFSENAWVNFKLFGSFGLMAVFIVAQALYMSRYMKDGKEAPAPVEEP